MWSKRRKRADRKLGKKGTGPLFTLSDFHPLISEWFERKFAAPTEPQIRGWPDLVAAADPLNLLVGIVLPGSRLSALSGGKLQMRDGAPVESSTSPVVPERASAIV